MERPTAPAPAIATRMLVLPFRRREAAARCATRSLSLATTWMTSPSCSTVDRPWARWPSPAGRGRRSGRRCLLQRLHLLADPAGRGHLGQHHRARRVAPQRLGALGQQLPQHLVGGPADRGHGGDAEPLVHLGPARVVDAGRHPRHAERLPGHPGRDDVGVVAAADRREGVRALDAGLCSTSRSKPTPVTCWPLKAGSSLRNASGSWSITATAVAPVLQDVGEGRPDPPATHDHDCTTVPSAISA